MDELVKQLPQFSFFEGEGERENWSSVDFCVIYGSCLRTAIAESLTLNARFDCWKCGLFSSLLVFGTNSGTQPFYFLTLMLFPRATGDVACCASKNKIDLSFVPASFAPFYRHPSFTWLYLISTKQGTPQFNQWKLMEDGAEMRPWISIFLLRKYD